MRALPALLVLGVLAVLPAPRAAAEGDDPPEGILWFTDVGQGLEAAKAQDRPIMIAINAKQVLGGRVEPAAKELREHTYKDPKVVKLASERFVCIFLTPSGSSDDYGELRVRYGIEGMIVSPQHIFAYPDGSLISRKEFWPYGTGDRAVDALLDLMNKALAKDDARRGTPAPEGGAEAPPPELTPAPDPSDAEARAAWIEKTLDLVRTGDPTVRPAALDALLDADHEGDTVTPVLALLEEMHKRSDVLIDVLRALGRPGLEAAVKPVGDLLGHRELEIRGNAAVTLEYIGSDDAVRALTAAVRKEDDVGTANDMYRALGRCGAGQAPVRTLLVKKVLGAKEIEGSIGPIIGLAYFEKDPKTAREVEDLIGKVGAFGGGRRGGGWGLGILRRSLLIWCLTETGFGDPKAERFCREELIPSVTPSPFAAQILEFYEAAAKCCAGDEEGKARVDQAITFALERSNAPNPFLTDARRDRDQSEFRPKGEWGSAAGS